MSVTIKSLPIRTFEVLTGIDYDRTERSDGYAKTPDTLCSCLPYDFPCRV